MARKKRPTKLRPRTPARIRKKRAPARKSQVASHHRAELFALALVAFGVFFGAVLYGSWNGGSAGGWLARGIRDVARRRGLRRAGRARRPRGAHARAQQARRLPSLPPRPDRDRARARARPRSGARRATSGKDSTRRSVTRSARPASPCSARSRSSPASCSSPGASVGAILRRSHHAARVVGRSAQQRLDRPSRPEPSNTVLQRLEEPGVEEPAPSLPPPLVDVVEDYPDLVSSEENAYEPAPLLVDTSEPDLIEDTQRSLFDVARSAAARVPPPGPRDPAPVEACERLVGGAERAHGGAARPHALELRCRGDRQSARSRARA